jgi:hypothetical protein
VRRFFTEGTNSVLVQSSIQFGLPVDFVFLAEERFAERCVKSFFGLKVSMHQTAFTKISYSAGQHPGSLLRRLEINDDIPYLKEN